MLIILFFISCPIINNITASNVAKTIWETPLPPHTEKVEKISSAGKLIGNGNGMQFLGAVLLKSSSSLNELKDYYKNYSENKWSYVVEEQKASEMNGINHNNLCFKTVVENDDYFVVYSWGVGVSPFCEFDLRGH